MIALIVFLAGVLVSLTMGVFAALSDLRTLKIPNLYSAVVIGAFVVTYVLLWMLGRADVLGPLLAHVISGGVVLAVSMALFALRVLGGGDSKLVSAFALWVGLKGLIVFLFYTALIGALLGVFALYVMRRKPFEALPSGSWLERVQAGESKVPYAVAIAGGALAAFLKLGFFAPATLASFL